MCVLTNVCAVAATLGALGCLNHLECRCVCVSVGETDGVLTWRTYNVGVQCTESRGGEVEVPRDRLDTLQQGVSMCACVLVARRHKKSD